MEEEKFVKLMARVFSKEASPEEEEEFNKLLLNNPELAKRYKLLDKFWNEEKDETRREEALNSVWSKIRNQK